MQGAHAIFFFSFFFVFFETLKCARINDTSRVIYAKTKAQML